MLHIGSKSLIIIVHLLVTVDRIDGTSLRTQDWLVNEPPLGPLFVA